MTFAPVDDLVSRVGGTVRREAGDTSIEAPVARLVELSAGVDGLTVRLDGFAPTSVLDSAGVYVVRLSNCRADLAEMSVTFGPADVGRATVVAAEGLACEIRVTFLEVAALAVNARDSGDDYTLLLSPSDTPALVSEAALGRRVLVRRSANHAGRNHGRRGVHSNGLVAKQDRHQPVPSGRETRECTARRDVDGDRSHGRDLVSKQSADRRRRDRRRPVLAWLGRLAHAVLRHPRCARADSLRVRGGSRCGLGAHTRSTGSAAPSAMTNSSATRPAMPAASCEGFPERFLVVRIRDGVVVSILDEPFVVADPSATLLIASGAARVRLAGLALGDRVDLICETVPERRMVTDALSIDGLLLWGGVPAAFSSTSMTWSLAGADWQGGFFFLSIVGTDALSGDDVAVILDLLPISLRDVAVLELGGAAALQLALTDFHAQWGRRDPISVGLGAFLR